MNQAANNRHPFGVVVATTAAIDSSFFPIRFSFEMIIKCIYLFIFSFCGVVVLLILCAGNDRTSSADSGTCVT